MVPLPAGKPGAKNLRTPLLLLFCALFSLFPARAEDLRNVYVWVTPVEGGSDTEKQYFYDNMRMELVGGGYNLAESRESSDFYLNIRIVHEEKDGAPLNYLNLGLYDSRTEKEIITLSWDYNNLEDMNIWNLYLVFQTMANAPIAKSVVVPAGEEVPSPAEDPPAPWYSKWLWIGAAGGADYFPDRPHLDLRLTAGLDFFSFMGFDAGLGYQANFPLVIDRTDYQYYHEIEQSFTLPLRLRFLIKTENLLVEPNGGIQFQFQFPGSYSGAMEHRTREESFILLPAILGGLDFRAKLGAGALGFGPRMIYDLETAAFGFGFTLGYQFGFFPKKPKAPKPDPSPLPVREESPEETGIQQEAPEETPAPEPEESSPPEGAAEEPEEGPPENPDSGAPPDLPVPPASE
jgi:hypothetical protein